MNTRRPGHHTIGWRVGTALVAIGLCAGALGAQSTRQRFSATAVNTSIAGRQGVLGPVDITLERFSTSAERERFRTALTDKGSAGLLDAFRNAPSIGKLGAPGRIGYDIRYAVEMPGEDGGRRIALASDRRMSFFEVRNRPRTVDYPFTVVMLQVPDNGSGKGWASLYSDITLDKEHGTIVLENLVDQPVMLLNVRASGS